MTALQTTRKLIRLSSEVELGALRRLKGFGVTLMAMRPSAVVRVLFHLGYGRFLAVRKRDSKQ